MTTDRAWQARQLLRAARVGTLATSIDGQPFASLVTPATAPDLSVLLLLSSLAEHTRHLRVEPRCSILVSGVAATENPQTTPRVTLTGVAESLEDPALKARFVSIHPYAAQYADFGDFALWRMRPEAALFVGGFARAGRLHAADLAPDPTALAAIAPAEADIIDHCNADHASALAILGGSPGMWRMMVVDVDGFDLSDGVISKRIAWTAPVSTVADIRRELTQAVDMLRRSGSA